MYKHDIVSEVLSPGKNKVDLIMPCNTFLGFPFPVICYKYFMHVQGQWKRKLLTPTEGPNPKYLEKKLIKSLALTLTLLFHHVTVSRNACLPPHLACH